MKVCFVLTHPSHGSPATFVRTHGIAKALASLNVQTSILSPFLKDPDITYDVDLVSLTSNYSYSKILSILYQGAKRLASSQYGSPLFYSSMAIEMMIKSIQKSVSRFFDTNSHKCDVLHAVQPLAGLACSPISKKLNIPLIVDLHNCWPEEVLSQKLCKRGDEVFKRLRSIEQKVMDSSDSITVVTQALKDYLVKNYSVDPKNIVVVPCGGTENLISNEIRREMKVVYAGTVNFREHVDLFVKSIPYVKSQVKFSISNYGDKAKDIRKLVKQMRDPRINLVWFEKHIDVQRHLHSSKLGVVTSRDDITRQLGPPLKLYDYLSFGLPVVANDVGGWTEIIRNERIGLLTNDDPAEFASAIDNLLNDESLWLDLHRNAVNLINQRYNWRAISNDFLCPLYSKIRA